jgi:ABC-2 type transport system ATP-binding protein
MTCRYGPVAAVDGLTLEVGRGELVGLIGPDGAGKTTALRAALGLRRPDEGSVETCGLDPARQSRRLSARVGYLPQRFSLYGDLSADENLAFFAAIHAVRGWRERRERLLDLVRLGPFRRRLADRLSGGMRQKLAVACTLIHSPDLLILDEPTTGVDPVSRRDLWALLARLQAGGMTIVLSTPYLDEAERCGRVALLDRGRLLATDRPEALRASFSGALVEILARPRREALARLRALPEAGEVETFGERFHCRLPGAAAAAEAAAALAGALRGGGLEVAVARPIAPSLEDVFLARIRAADDAAAAHPGRAAGG